MPPRPSPSVPTLEALFGTETPRFLESWPNRQVAVVARGFDTRRPGFLDIPGTVDDLVRQHVGSIGAQAPDPATGDPTKALGLTAGEAIRLHRMGVALQLHEAERTWSAIDELASGLRADLGLPGSRAVCTIFVSPAGGGLPRHFDDKDVWVIGLSGRKTFVVSPNEEVPFPYWIGDRLGPETSGGPRLRVDVAPGDCLFLPRGIFHETASPAPSWSLSLGLTRPTLADLLLEALRLDHGETSRFGGLRHPSLDLDGIASALDRLRRSAASKARLQAEILERARGATSEAGP
jgi:hypothetical protein